MRLILISLIYSTSSLAGTFAQDYQHLSDMLDSKTQKCIEQNINIVKKGAIELDQALQDTDEYYSFIKDEKQARELILSFDINNINPKEALQYSDIIAKNCSQKNLINYFKLEKNRQGCHFIFDELSFMKALIYATKNYPWSRKTKLIAREKLLTYIKYQGQKETPIINKLIAISLLKSMIKYELIKEALKARVEIVSNQSEEMMSKLKARTIANPKLQSLSCDTFLEGREVELNYNEALSNELGSIYTDIDH